MFLSVLDRMVLKIMVIMYLVFICSPSRDDSTLSLTGLKKGKVMLWVKSHTPSCRG